MVMSASIFQFPVLIADIGGTNGRFGVAHENGRITRLESVRNCDFSTVEEAIAHVLTGYSEEAPISAALAIACPIVGETFRLTNAKWEIQPGRFLAQTGLTELIVMNDFLAQGLAAVRLDETGLLQIGGKSPDENAPKVIIGPGTGLGVALALNLGGRWTIVPGEGGHVDIGPRTEREFELWPFLEKRCGRMEAELAISGRGLQNIHSAILQCAGIELETVSPETISQRALDHNDPHAREALEILTSLLARLCGDLAITTMARGGVYLCGGMVKHLLPLLQLPEFRRTFDEKQPLETVMCDIPMYAVMHQHSGLFGIAEYLKSPASFHLEGNISRFS